MNDAEHPTNASTSGTEHEEELPVNDSLIVDEMNTKETLEETPEETVELTSKQIAKQVRKLPDDEIVKLVHQASDAERNLELARRQTAEMENLRKRLEGQRQRDAKYALSPLVRDLLETLDNLERALKASDDNPAAKGLADGVQLTLKLFEQSLAKHGVTPLEPLHTPFDPEFHDAVMTGSNPEFSNNTVIACFERGWVLHDRVVRPAKVQVNKLDE